MVGVRRDARVRRVNEWVDDEDQVSWGYLVFWVVALGGSVLAWVGLIALALRWTVFG